MKLVAFLLGGTLIIAGAARGQQTQVLVQNEQIKVDLSTYPESCSVLRTAKDNPNSTSTASTCMELAITNESSMPITAWVVTVEKDRPDNPGKQLMATIRAADNVLFEKDLRNNPVILPRDTHRVLMGSATRVEFQAAIFQDGTTFGDPEWITRVVQNRRQVYQDVAESLQKLREAVKAGTSRDEVIREFQAMERDMRDQERAKLQAQPGRVRLMLPKLGIYQMVAMDVESAAGPGGGGLSTDIDRVDSMLLGIAQRLLVSKPPIADHLVPVGDPLASAATPAPSPAPQP